MNLVTMHGLGRKDRRVRLATEEEIATYVDPGRTLGVPRAAISHAYGTRQITHPELWCDTSETLTLIQYQFLASIGYRGCFRYIPIAGGGGGISATEIAAALSVKCPDGSPFSLMFVQFSRTANISEDTGTQDGLAAVTYLRGLSIPNSVYWSQDLYPTIAANCIAYSNASYTRAVQEGWMSTSIPAYMEPGYPLTAAQRQALDVHAYWATAANDANRFPSPRGCQIVQSWGSRNGEWFPEAGLVIDSDLVQFDWWNCAPIALIAA